MQFPVLQHTLHHTTPRILFQEQHPCTHGRRCVHETGRPPCFALLRTLNSWRTSSNSHDVRLCRWCRTTPWDLSQSRESGQKNIQLAERQELLLLLVKDDNDEDWMLPEPRKQDVKEYRLRYAHQYEIFLRRRQCLTISIWQPTQATKHKKRMIKKLNKTTSVTKLRNFWKYEGKYGKYVRVGSPDYWKP